MCGKKIELTKLSFLGENNNKKVAKSRGLFYSSALLHNIETASSDYLLIAQIKSCSKVSYCFNVELLKLQIWLAGCQLCMRDEANGGLAPLRQTVIFNQQSHKLKLDKLGRV